MKILPDPLYMRILSGAVFAAAFVWVAISYFDVDPAVVEVFAILSVIFVGGLIVLGFVFALVLRLFRRRHHGGLLDSIAAGSVAEPTAAGDAEHLASDDNAKDRSAKNRSAKDISAKDKSAKDKL